MTRTSVLSAGVVAVVFSACVPAPVVAYGARDVAGTLNGEPVRLGEVDAALDGAVRSVWARIDAIVREAARAVCVEYATVRVAAATGLDVAAWRARQWRMARPSASAVRAFIAEKRRTFGGPRPTRQDVTHLLHVRAYRRRVAAATDRLLEGDYTLALPAPPARFEQEPVLPPVLAQCLGHMVTRHEVEAFAAVPLYRWRTDVVASSCRQFDIDYSNPVVLYRMAQARGLTVEELMRAAEGGDAEVSDAVVEEVPRASSGAIDEQALARARFAVVAKQKVERRIAFLEKVRAETVGTCVLEGPRAPTVTVRGAAPGGAPGGRLRVSYFGGFRCRSCAAGWQAVDRLRQEWGDRIHVDVRHNFPVTAWPLFKEAMETHCSAWAGLLWDYVAWRTRTPTADALPVQALDLDARAFATCMRDPTTAVAVIADTDEALRLGFRDAVPSWVIGYQPRRGIQGDAVLNESVQRALDADALASRDDRR